MHLLLLALSMVGSCWSLPRTAEKLPVSVVVLFRHGDRTPVDPYPLDPWGDAKYWPVPFGELTDIGKRQHYELGKILRKRYGHLLPEKYDPKSIYVRSTDLDRTLQSVEYNLAGMFPVNESEAIIPKLLWQGIPIHTVPKKMDPVLSMKAPCPNFDLEMEKLMNTEYFINILKECEPVFRYISNHTGKKINDLTNAAYLYDNLFIEELYNLTLPEWTKEVYPEKLLQITKLFFRLNTFTEKLAHLRIGPLVSEITEHFVSVMFNQNYPKLKLYSCHDTTIASMMDGLKIKFDDLPPYASTLIFEIYADGDQSVSIQTMYQFKKKEIPNCGVMCPINQWVKNYKGLMSKNHTYECTNSFDIISAYTYFPYIIYLLTSIAVFSVITNAVLIHRYSKSLETKKISLNAM